MSHPARAVRFSCAFLVAFSCAAIDCTPAPVIVATLPIRGTTIETREPPRRPGLDDRLTLTDGERRRTELFHRVRAPGAELLHCPTAYSEEIAGDGMFYFNGCGRVVVLECRAPSPSSDMQCRHPGTPWPESTATRATVNIGAVE